MAVSAAYWAVGGSQWVETGEMMQSVVDVPLFVKFERVGGDGILGAFVYDLGGKVV